jgi:hypothetical protein
MVDVETTGLRPDRNAMIQLSGVKFNLKTREVCHDFFDRCLEIPPHRAWDEGTRLWWHGPDKIEHLQKIYGRMEPPAIVMDAFRIWSSPMGSLRFWAKPTTFDFMFVSGYFRDYGMPDMFSYREATDVNSFLRGLHFPDTDRNNWASVPFEGTIHDAIMDSLNQIAVLFANLDAVRNRRCAEVLGPGQLFRVDPDGTEHFIGNTGPVTITEVSNANG